MTQDSEELRVEQVHKEALLEALNRTMQPNSWDGSFEQAIAQSQCTVIDYFDGLQSQTVGAVDGKHSSHQTRMSDASSYDEVCVNCGATDVSGNGWGRLAEPCAATAGVDRVASERQFLDAIIARTPTGAWIEVKYHPNGDWSVAHSPLATPPSPHPIARVSEDTAVAVERVDYRALLEAVLNTSGARGEYHSRKYAEAVEAAEAALQPQSGEAGREN